MKSCCRRRVKYGVDSNDDARDEIHGVECVSTDVSQELEIVSLAFSTVDQVLKPRRRRLRRFSIDPVVEYRVLIILLC